MQGCGGDELVNLSAEKAQSRIVESGDGIHGLRSRLKKYGLFPFGHFFLVRSQILHSDKFSSLPRMLDQPRMFQAFVTIMRSLNDVKQTVCPTEIEEQKCQSSQTAPPRSTT